MPTSAFSTFHAIEKNNSGIFNALVIGPWVHGVWARYDGEHLGRVDFSFNTGEYYRKNILFPFFEQYLKGSGDAKLPKAYVFETGTNLWPRYSAWPPKDVESKTLYFRAGGGLSFDPPSSDSPAYDEYVSDPAKPVPFINYVGTRVPQEYMVSDQRFAFSRTDVLVYETPAPQEDVTIAGPISPRLFVSTTGTDSDWDVKLINVYPPDYPDSKLDEAKPEDRNKPRADVPPPSFTMGGYQQLVRGEPFRGKFRHSFEKPEAFTPGKVEEIDFTMPDVNHTFRRGHRVMVQVQSSWFPLTDRNPQTFVNIPDAKPSDFVKATERVYHAKGRLRGLWWECWQGRERQRRESSGDHGEIPCAFDSGSIFGIDLPSIPYYDVRNLETERRGMATATVTSKGQITIPARVRNALGVDAGDRIEFVEVGKGEFNIIAATRSVKELKGLLYRKGQKPVSIEEMNAAIAKGAARSR